MKKDNQERSFSSRLILLIDDSDMLREFAKILLEKEGYTILCAKDGYEAISIFQENKAFIMLVILDLNMPGISGKECFKVIREILPGIPVIIASGYIAPEMSYYFTSSGKCQIITKPYQIQELLTMVSDSIQPVA
ncbi:MAG: response regulator [Candidatus Coatesbacteria bacterium]|nr:response regulator [Candidatus Coatesbacteria bacterium]